MSRPRPAATPMALVSLALAAALITGCSGGDDRPSAAASTSPGGGGAGSTAATTAPGTGGTTGSAAATATATPGTSGSPTASGGTGTCPAGQLQFSLGRQGGAAGHVVQLMLVRNTGSGNCTLDGYVAVQIIAAGGKRLPTTTTHGAPALIGPAPAPKPVTLAKGAYASFNLGWASVPTGTETCPTGTAIAITPPGTKTAQTVALRTWACGSRIGVSAIVAGKDGPTS